MAGLSAGCYARMNGFDAQIFELHDKPGGLCTAWKRGDYVFDGCLQWLVGTSPRSGFHRMWLELGALDDRPVIDHEEFLRYEADDGRTLIFYTDVGRLRAHLEALCPLDTARIAELMHAIDHFRGVQPILDRPHGLKELLEQAGKLLDLSKAAPDFLRYVKTSVHDFAASFHDPIMSEALSSAFDLPDFPMLAFVATLAWHANRDAGYPVGGSLALARAIEHRYRALAGRVAYGARVQRVLVEHDRAVGVELADGTHYHADYVISAGDGRAAIFDLLDGRYLNHELRARYGTLPRFPSLVRVSLGVARDLSAEPNEWSVPLREPIVVDGRARSRIVIRHYGYDPSCAPRGKSVVSVSFPASYDAWLTLHQQPEHYAAEKHRIARAVIAALETRWPGFARAVEQIDVATPLTYERFTANWDGSMEGFLLTTHSMTLRMPDTLPGLERFRMIGQWTQPGGGLPTAAWSGRNVLRALCEEQGKPFETELAR